MSVPGAYTANDAAEPPVIFAVEQLFETMNTRFVDFCVEFVTLPPDRSRPLVSLVQPMYTMIGPEPTLRIELPDSVSESIT